MAQDSGLDFKINAEWQDITALSSDLAGNYSWVSNQGWGPVLVSYTSSAIAPTGGGYYLQPGEKASGTAIHIWVKCVAGSAIVSAGLGDAGDSEDVSTVSVPNGADAAQGAIADPAATDSTSAWTAISLLKGLWAKLNGTLTTQPSVGGAAVSTNNPLPVVPTSLPLPNGGATSALQAAGIGILGEIHTQLPATLGPAVSASAIPVVIASDQVIPVSSAVATSAPLASGTPYDFTRYGTIRIQVRGLASGDTVSFGGAISQTDTPDALEVMAISGASPGALSATITANGQYVIFGAGGLWITPTHGGSGTTPIIIANANQ